MNVTQPSQYSPASSLQTTEWSPENFALLLHFLVLRAKGSGTQPDKTVGAIAIVYSELVFKGVARFASDYNPRNKLASRFLRGRSPGELPVRHLFSLAGIPANRSDCKNFCCLVYDWCVPQIQDAASAVRDQLCTVRTQRVNDFGISPKVRLETRAKARG